MLSICVISDLHGYLPELKPCELVLICGDSVPLEYQASSKKTKKWYDTTFRKWAGELPCDKVLFIAGNHELHFPGKKIIYESLFSKDDKITYLCHSEYIHKSKDGKEYKIFGTPYCKQFMNWAFMYPNEELEKIFKNIPNDLDILISHDNPYGYGDIVLQECPWADGSHIGNIPLAKAIEEKQPKYQFNGHLHSCDHSLIMIGNTKHYNCSIKDEQYNPVYEPLYLNI